MADGIYVDWGSYEDLYIVGGRPAAAGVYTIDGEAVYIGSNNKPLTEIVYVDSAEVADAFGITVGKRYAFENGKLFTGTGYWNESYPNIAIVNGRPV